MADYATTAETLSPECKPSNHRTVVPPFCLILFGGGGDLSRRMLLPAIYHLYSSDNLVKEFSIVSVGLPAYSHEEYRALVREAIKRFSSETVDERRCDEFAGHLYYLSGGLDEDEVYTKICDMVSETSPFLDTEDSNLIYYCAVPPAMHAAIAGKLKKNNICSGVFNTKIVVEKPFGLDRPSAVTLNRMLLDVFDEKQIYRIDHYLGKDTVQNIIFFRFGNSIFEPLWNRRYVDHVQITVTESIGIEHRGSLYEQIGVVRDIVQNHVLQLLALVAMEPPIGFDAELIRDEKSKLLRTVRLIKESEVNKVSVRGQYGQGMLGGKNVPGYRQEEGVSLSSTAPTFFAGVFYIDNWRWAGVPFYMRAGKRMAAKATEIYVQFKQPPLRLFKDVCEVLEPNALILSVQPQEELSLRLSVKKSGIATEPYTVQMKFDYPGGPSGPHLSYERQVIDFMQGDLRLFSREEGVEAMWSIVDPILKKWETDPPKDFPNYPSGGWGPEAANRLIERDGRKWHSPV
jgi:glucose-6-phosphate 1-dehydrogenase